jgi:hypothetical protein
MFTIRGEFSLDVFASLFVHPVSQSVPVFHVARWNSSMALTLSESAKMAKALPPLSCKRVPTPTGKGFELSNSVEGESPKGVVSSLLYHPPAQAVPIFH